MFRRKKAKTEEGSAQVEMPQQSSASMGPGGYQIVEVPTYHAGKRRVVVYKSDATGRIIKTFKK